MEEVGFVNHKATINTVFGVLVAPPGSTIVGNGGGESVIGDGVVCTTVDELYDECSDIGGVEAKTWLGEHVELPCVAAYVEVNRSSEANCTVNGVTYTIENVAE